MTKCIACAVRTTPRSARTTSRISRSENKPGPNCGVNNFIWQLGAREIVVWADFLERRDDLVDVIVAERGHDMPFSLL
jgi:hypothetical protein